MARRIIPMIVTLVLALSICAHAGNKRVMTIRAAKVLAERALVESIYGLKVRATEEVENMVAASFLGRTESKTAAMIKGVKFDEIIYDPEKDIAKATASVQLNSLTNIDGEEMDLRGKVFTRVGFATSTPSNAGPLQALRAAELDAYKQLVKRIVGFTLESQTTVENYMLTSDVVKTKVIATCYLAQLVDFGWEDNGDAYVKLALNVSEIGQIIGQQLDSAEELIEVEGAGAQEDDFSTAQQQAMQQPSQ